MNTENVTLKIKGIKNQYTFLHITDAHIACAVESDSDTVKDAAANSERQWSKGGIKPCDAIRDFIDTASESGADAIIASGDCVDFFGDTTFTYLRDCFCACSPELFYVPGNHERWIVGSEKSIEAVYAEDFAPIMNGRPEFWARDYGDLIAVGLDNSEHKVTQRQISALRAQICRGKPIVLIMHMPIMSESIAAAVDEKWGAGAHDYFILDGVKYDEPTRRFCDLVRCAGSNIAAIFAGHIHIRSEGEFAPGRMQYTAAPLFNGYVRKVTVIPE